MGFPKDLLEKVDAIISDTNNQGAFLKNDKLNREILYWERIFRHSQIEIPFSLSLLELFEKAGRKTPPTVGPRNYSLSLYRFGWEKDENETFSFFIENIELKRKLTLQKAPSWMKEVLAPLMEAFSIVFAQYLERLEKGLEICDSIPRNQSLFQ
ncbi:MAG: hypothetical protein VXY34_05735 [Bdellovibrionota bacterium]|nr:hypothetical protein [Bdellovibrionota bacterium]